MLTETLAWISAAIFAIALVYTFSTSIFEKLAHRQPNHAGVWHLLGEVEIVFGFWAMVLIVIISVGQGTAHATHYLDERNYTEPLFVLAIMVAAGTRPIIDLGSRVVSIAARLLPLPSPLASYFALLGLVPLMGSLITGPAAMTLGALLLRDRCFVTGGSSARLQYVTLGVLCVNVSIGGVLTSFAAPPVLMVAGAWGWDTPFMLSHFGGKAAVAVAINAAGATLLLRRELLSLPPVAAQRSSMPWLVTVAHVLFLVGIVAFAHHPQVFLGLLMLFLGFATAYNAAPGPVDAARRFAGGACAAWWSLGGQLASWLQPSLPGLSADAVLVGATALTAVTDNAALTYFGSLVPNLSDEFKYALVSGAVAGVGLTVIANAPNPAGFAMLRGRFENETVQPSRLLAAALLPTLVALAALR
jgi:hypothetical protein